MTFSLKAVGCAVVAGLSLAACSTSPDSGGSPGSTSTASGDIKGKLTVLYDKSFQSALDPVAKAFERKYPGTKVDVNYVSGDVSNLISNQIQAGTAADVFITQPGSGGAMNVHTLAPQGSVRDLSDAPWVADIPKLWRGDMAYKGKTYAYPGTIQGLGGIYNLTKMKELGLKVPTTWGQVLGLCKSAKEHHVYAYAQGFNDPAGPQMVYLALAGSLVYGPTPDFSTRVKEKKTSIPASPWKEVLTKYKQMNDAGCFGEGAMGRTRPQGGTELAAGKALGMIEVGAGLAPVQLQAPKSKFTVAALPATNNPADNYFTALPGYTLSANAKAKNPGAAKAFLNLLAEPKNINRYAEGYASSPLIPNDDFKAPATLGDFDKAVADGKAAKLADWPNPKVNEVAQQGVQAIFLGKDSVDGVLKKMQNAYGD
ncbi:extracellular solute-binding protein [Streptomyces sp. NPDC005373]|uniref:ABC transporter substrate-binding protein n=1 Tax=Streptomyces sp. NPDC005373 TaxID=3156879 RepID=UPI0033BC251C